MRNITLSVDDEVIDRARRYAAQHNSSLNNLVREYLHEIASREDEVAAARKQIREMSRRSKARIGNQKWTREDLYAR